MARAQGSGAAAGGAALGSASGLPVPRFVSLKTDKVNMHVGPAKTYEVKWTVPTRRGLPVEITAEFENWRRIRNSEGTEGWVYHSLLSGKRTGVVTAKQPDELVPVYAKPDADSAVVAKLERGVVGVVQALQRRLVRHQRHAASTAGSSRSGCGASIPTRRWIDRVSARSRSRPYPKLPQPRGDRCRSRASDACRSSRRSRQAVESPTGSSSATGSKSGE